MPMVERKFVILKYRDKVPALTSCAKCQLKFFTPTTYYRDPIEATEYLLGKFDRHQCGSKDGKPLTRNEYIR
jgi:hypothetical protein